VRHDIYKYAHLFESVYIYFAHGHLISCERKKIEDINQQNERVLFLDNYFYQLFYNFDEDASNDIIKYNFIDTFDRDLSTNEESKTDGTLKTPLDFLIYDQIYIRNADLVKNITEKKNDSSTIIATVEEGKQIIAENMKERLFNDDDVKSYLYQNAVINKNHQLNINFQELLEEEGSIIKNKFMTFLEDEIQYFLLRKESQINNVNSIFDILDDFYDNMEVLRDPNFKFKCKNGKIIDYTNLSTGEKQLLYIMLLVSNSNNSPCILFMDEPDLGMHVEWKEIFIKTLRRINPNMQIILSTHSPSMIEGYFDRVKEMGEISIEV
ncbi:MAG: ATP-binding protein, partial [Bacteroides sp.]|nr:ATP-binding protein [Bacteroides sp.]